MPVIHGEDVRGENKRYVSVRIRDTVKATKKAGRWSVL